MISPLLDHFFNLQRGATIVLVSPLLLCILRIPDFWSILPGGVPAEPCKIEEWTEEFGERDKGRVEGEKEPGRSSSSCGSRSCCSSGQHLEVWGFGHQPPAGASVVTLGVPLVSGPISC